MSERLNSVDIEDVLSSIRRLVSDDLRPVAKATVPPAAPVEPAQADKLILTPALRIAPEADEPAAVSAPDPAAAVQAPMPEAALSEPVMSFHSVRPERGAARLDAVMGQVARELESGPGDWETAAEPPARFESDWSEPEAELSQEPAAADDAISDAPPLGDPQEGGDVWAVAESEAPFVDLDSDFMPDSMASTDPATVSFVAEPFQAEPISAMDVLPGADALDVAILDPRDVTSDMTSDALADMWPDQDWAAPGEPDILLDGAAPDAPAEAGWPEAATIDSQPVAMAEEPAMTDKDDPADLPESDLPEPDLPDWARMETEPVDMDPVNIKPPVAPAAAQQGSTDPRWADAAEAEIRRELEDEVTASAFARFADDDLDDRPFDEEMLRDLVRDIIREELQGALGERITRNVRKLVRAEIARALAVRDFE
jgi:hypothetical protein